MQTICKIYNKSNLITIFDGLLSIGLDQNIYKSPLSLWWYCAEQGAVGNYRAAQERLSVIASCENIPPPIRSLALSTIASHHRQMGYHSSSRKIDGAALVLAYCKNKDLDRIQCDTLHLSSEFEKTCVDEKFLISANYRYLNDSANYSQLIFYTAVLDALIGLAADSIGRGELCYSHKFLARAKHIIDSPTYSLSKHSFSKHGDPRSDAWIFSQRLHLRWLWVSAELALVYNSPSARVFAKNALDLACVIPSQRHRVKSELIAIAAGVLSRKKLDSIRTICVDAQLWPLAWAGALLAQDHLQAQEMEKHFHNISSTQ